MSVPLDRLYNFLHDVCNRDDIVIYRFYPHGSRNLSDLLLSPLDIPKHPRHVIFHDQEPLDFDAYSSDEVAEEYIKNSEPSLPGHSMQKLKNFYKKLNLRMVVYPAFYMSRPILLVHSEKNSINLLRYEEELGFVGVYWWCHAIIARDWFRYAEHDPMLRNRAPNSDFLIYNRAWSGTREYRLKFTELLVDAQLVKNCYTKFNPVDDGKSYVDHIFKNKIFNIQSTNLEQIFDLNTADSSASADYDNVDYCNTNLEVVLETLFDDSRIQLTEKILRPIACGHPFMLASTPGSLEYLRSYGFETFGQFIDESYDTIEDPLDRLKTIVSEMKRLANLSIEEKQELYANLRAIAAKNKKLFFSIKWHDQIVEEFKHNIKIALEKTNTFKIDFSDFKNVP